MKKRASGILLHITSLPSRNGVGDFGPEAYKFADFLAKSKQRYWQILPLTAPAAFESPYNCLSAFAGNSLLISPELLYRDGFLGRHNVKKNPKFPSGYVNYRRVVQWKTKLLNMAFKRFKDMPRDPEYRFFCKRNEEWLEDYALFICLRRRFQGRLWRDWPAGLRDRRQHTIRSITAELKEDIERQKFVQYVFFKQWFSLKRYCNEHGIRIIGDIPIYVSCESADVWAHPEIFKLTRTKRPKAVSGVPPGAFSRMGQLWGNPVYNWEVLKRTGYSWWVHRVRHNLAMFDIVRLDHFRGFIDYWEIPTRAKTAVQGKWVDGPKEDFFKALFSHFPVESIIIEDLGYIDEEVRELVEKYDFTSMKVLLFAFEDDDGQNAHWPHNHSQNCVVYTGTHDNNTVKGWFTKEAGLAQKRRLFNYLGRRVSAGQIHWELIRLAMSSIGNVVIIPMQDVLGLGKQTRMNQPGTVRGNWAWRLERGQIKPSITKKLANLTKTYGRVCG